MPGDGSLGADSYSFDSDRCNLVTSHSTCANIKKANSLLFQVQETARPILHQQQRLNA